MRRHKIPPKKCICGTKYQIIFNRFAELKCPECDNHLWLDEETTEYLKELKEKRIKKAQLRLSKMFNYPPPSKG
jgi:hypothetical protein